MRRLWAAALLLGSCSKPAPPPPLPPAPAPITPVSRAVDWLVSKAADGVWKSTSIKSFESGQALTPFVLYALAHVPPEGIARYRAVIDRALDRLPISGAEYPNYALALSILALKRLRPAQDVSTLVRDLRSRQLTEQLDWSPDDPEYGGWDEGVIPARKPQCQRPNLSVTAFACEALGGDEKAKVFVAHCRVNDGGFLFTPNKTWSHQNKRGKAGYATTTYDAHRILGTPAVYSIRDLPHWLDMPEEYGPSMVYYQAFAEAKADGPFRDSIRKTLLALQKPDGSWANPHPLMKEDEPLVATGLALVALCLCP